MEDKLKKYIEDIKKEHVVYYKPAENYTKAKYLLDKRTIYLIKDMNKKNIVVIDKEYKIKMSVETNYNIRTIENYINTLCKQDILKKKEKNIYIINKNYFRYYDGEKYE